VLALSVPIPPKLRVATAQTEHMPFYARTFLRVLSSWVHYRKVPGQGHTSQQRDPERVSTQVASKAHVPETAAMTPRTVKTIPIAMNAGPKNLLLARASASSSRCFFIVGSE
jgi:hypothetical protein